MNDTKWNELRLAMYNLAALRPRWRTKDVNGYVCPWDGEWYYHFRGAGYSTIEWVEIETTSADQDGAVFELLQKIHLPGLRIDNGYRIYGYAQEGVAVDWL
jgi:hypothetical protein